MQGFVLAGGRSRRMGWDKSQASAGGLTLLERAVATLRSAGFEVGLVRAADQEGGVEGCPVAFDIVPEAGPLGGILTALTVASSDLCAILACDIPLVGADLFRTLVDAARDWDAAAPVDSQGRIHPLCAVYKKSCLASLRRRVEERRLKTVAWLTSGEIRRRMIQPGLHGLPDWRFLNVNTAADLVEVRRFFLSEGS